MASTENSGVGKYCGCQNPFCTEPHATKAEQQAFTTGATRSADDHKFDYEGFLSPEVLQYFGAYMHKNRVQRDGKLRASDNWQQGIPLHKYMKSMLRHTFDLWLTWRGTLTYNPDTKQPQTLGELGAAILFNVQGMLLELMREGLTERTYITTSERKAIENPSEEKMFAAIKPAHLTTKEDTTYLGYEEPADAAFRQMQERERY